MIYISLGLRLPHYTIKGKSSLCLGQEMTCILVLFGPMKSHDSNFGK